MKKHKFLSDMARIPVAKLYRRVTQSCLAVRVIYGHLLFSPPLILQFFYCDHS